MQFLNPINDFAFKKIFGDENRKHVLINFLNSILCLPLDAQIVEVSLLSPHQAPHLPGAKETILDVRCQDQKGAYYIVEMQVMPQSFFDKRALYYASRAYAHQLDSGMNYDLLKPIVFLGILNFEFTESQYYLSTHCIQDIDSQEKILNDFQFTFAELPKFNKTENELVTVEEKWLYFLKYAPQLETIPKVIHETALREAFEVLNRLNWDKQSLEMYDYRAMQVQDEIWRAHYSYTKGLRMGKEEGIKQGIERGIAKGIAKGIEKGIEQGLKKGIKEGLEKGITQGKQQGLQEGQANFLIALLIERFGVLSALDRERIERANLEQLLVWGKKVLSAGTIDQVLE